MDYEIISLLVLALVVYTHAQFGKKLGDCPPLPPGKDGKCFELCSSDTDCGRLEKCCLNGCGSECRSITTIPRPTISIPTFPTISRPIIRECFTFYSRFSQTDARICTESGFIHSGFCPFAPLPNQQFGNCGQRCLSDSDCPSDSKCCATSCGFSYCAPLLQRCCSNGCGHECRNVFGGIVPEIHPGFCPALRLDQQGICLLPCQTDADCLPSFKCCITSGILHPSWPFGR
ncbi:hypothetical protein B566_EDAN000740 [Ephemera danica]|nr:hypothetical protein B566_EDAN000740 [Ephemera danica]